MEDPALDLAVCMSLLSSYEEVRLPNDVCFAAEVGLGGEIRAVNHIESRISEAEKLGFRKVFVAKNNLKSLENKQRKIAIEGLSRLSDAFQKLF